VTNCDIRSDSSTMSQHPSYDEGHLEPVVQGRIRPPVKWHGGKYYLARRILEHFPDHHTYVEPFGGAASVLLNKTPAPVEVYNDLDERLTRLFRVLRDEGEEFRRRLSLTPYSQAEFDQASRPAGDEIEQARRDFVRLRMSIGGRGDSFSYTLHRVRRGMADVVSGYLSMIDEELPLIAQRMRAVQIVRRPALDVIRTWDGPGTLFYCDPPYLHSTRDAGSTTVYDHEMTEAEHVLLGEALSTCRGDAIVSGYPSPLYDGLYKGWRSVTIDIANHAAGGKSKQRKTETLWIKPSVTNPSHNQDED
jgi:DNA adenine methylase